jgi:anti-sigma factor RsiW
MNCHEAEQAISAGRDEILAPARRSALSEHLASCECCRRFEAELAAAAAAWREGSRAVRVPDADHEWLAIRDRLIAGAKEDRRAVEHTVFERLAWFSVPLAGAAAALVAGFYFFVSGPAAGGSRVPTEVARAEFVEIADESASPIVYVDEESGWLVVWTVSDAGSGG